MVKKVKTIIRGLFKLIYGRVNFDNNINYSTIASEIDKYDNETKSDQKYFLYSSDNCRIYTDLNENVAVIKDRIILDGHSYQQVNGKLESLKQNSVLKNGTPYFKKKINGTILNLLQGSSGENYFHFMFDILPKLWLVESKIKFEDIDYFLLNKRIDWQIKILKIIGINSNKILSAKQNRHIEATKIISVTHPWYLEGYIQEQVSNIPSWIIYELRAHFLNKYISKKNLKIFIDRSDSKFKHCKIMNSNELISFLKKRNFQIVKPENLSLNEQIDIFNNAKIIAGGHGAALTNIIFCEKKTNIIEFIPSNHPSRKCERISKILNLNYFRFITKDTKDDKQFPYNINVDLDELEKNLNLY